MMCTAQQKKKEKIIQIVPWVAAEVRMEQC